MKKFNFKYKIKIVFIYSFLKKFSYAYSLGFSDLKVGLMSIMCALMSHVCIKVGLMSIMGYMHTCFTCTHDTPFVTCITSSNSINIRMYLLDPKMILNESPTLSEIDNQLYLTCVLHALGDWSIK